MHTASSIPRRNQTEQQTNAKKEFNTVGSCIKDRHYTVPLDQNRYASLLKMQRGAFVNLYSHRQGAKSTRLMQLMELQANFFVIFVDLRGCALRQSEEIMYGSIMRRIFKHTLLKNSKITIKGEITKVDFLDYFETDQVIHQVCTTNNLKGVILVFDELHLIPPKLINNFYETFFFLLDYLQNAGCCLWGCVVAGIFPKERMPKSGELVPSLNRMHDIESYYFTLPEVQTLFEEFSKDYNIQISTELIKEIHHQTAGHPAFVCQVGRIIQQQFVEGKQLYMHDLYSVFEIVLNKKNTKPLYDILAAFNSDTVEGGSEYLDKLKEYLIQGARIQPNTDDVIDYLVDSGVLKQIVTDQIPKSRFQDFFIDFVCPLVCTALVPDAFEPERTNFHRGHNIPDLLCSKKTFISILQHFLQYIQTPLLKRGSTKTQTTSTTTLSDKYRNVPSEANWHFLFYSFISWVASGNFLIFAEFKLWITQQPRKRIDLYLKNSSERFGIVLASAPTGQEFNKYITRTQRYCDLLDDDTIFLVTFTSLPKDHWPTEYSTGVDGKVHKYIVCHDPELTEATIHFGDVQIPVQFPTQSSCLPMSVPLQQQKGLKRKYYEIHENKDDLPNKRVKGLTTTTTSATRRIGCYNQADLKNAIGSIKVDVADTFYDLFGKIVASLALGDPNFKLRIMGVDGMVFKIFQLCENAYEELLLGESLVIHYQH